MINLIKVLHATCIWWEIIRLSPTQNMQFKILNIVKRLHTFSHDIFFILFYSFFLISHKSVGFPLNYFRDKSDRNSMQKQIFKPPVVLTRTAIPHCCCLRVQRLSESFFIMNSLQYKQFNKEQENSYQFIWHGMTCP